MSESMPVTGVSPIAKSRSTWLEWPGWSYVLVGLAVALRLAHIWNSRGNPTFWAPAVDPGWYDQAAQNILQGNWGPFPFFRAPVYHTLLAGVYAIFGHDLFMARVLNVVLQGATVWIIWRVGRSYFSPLTGFLAALLFAVNGTTIYFAGELVSPSVEMLASALAMWATFRLLREFSPSALVLCGLAWSFAAITRPNFLFVFPVVALAVVWIARRIAGTKLSAFGIPALRSVAIWGLAALVPIVPITLVNWVKGGELVLIATQGGVNFWIGNNPESTGILSVLPGYGNTWTMEDAEAEAAREVGRPLRPGELSDFYYAKGWAFLKSHPGAAIRFMIRKTALFFNQFEISNNKHIPYFSALSPWLPFLIKVNFGVLVPLGILGLWVLWRLPQTKLLTVWILVYAISVVLFFVTSRFRMPTVPWLCLLAAGGLVWLLEMVRVRAKFRQFAPALLLIPGITLAHLNIWDLHEAPASWARYMEGNAFMKLGQLDSARIAFEDAVADGMQTAMAELNLGVIAGRQGDTLLARQWYERSLRHDSSNVDAWNNLGTVYESQGDTTMALQAYEQALRLKPSAPDPRHNLAGMHFRLGIRALKAGADSVAVGHFERCILLMETPAAHYDLALALERLGNYQRALIHVDRAAQLDPNLPATRPLRERIQAALQATPAGGATP